MTQTRSTTTPGAASVQTGPKQFRRINPYAGLMIDAEIWRDAHDYHRDQLRLHHSALHGWGIVQGLHVRLVEGADNTLRLEPGLAIDATGNFIVVQQPHTYRLMSREAAPIFLVLQFREVLAEPAPPGNGQGAGQPTRILEAYRIQERDRLPDEPYLELARIDYDPSAGPIREAASPDGTPGRNELDRRARVYLRAVGEGESAASVPSSSNGEQAAEAVRQALAGRLDALESGVERLSTRFDLTSASRSSDTAGPQPAPAANGGVSLDQVETISRVVALQQVEALDQRLQALTQQLGALGSGAVGSPAKLEALTLQVRGISETVDGLATQLRFVTERLDQSPVAAVRVGLADHHGAGWDRHADGLGHLVRAVSGAGDWVGRDAGRVTLDENLDLDLLYMAGEGSFSLTDAEVDTITRLLDRGGTIVAEGCASGQRAEAGALEFARSFVELAARLGRQLTRVRRTHPLMVARYVFAEPPPGNRPSPVVREGGGMVYTDGDYGCAWQGGSDDRSLTRGVIRDAVDFGVNMVLYQHAILPTSR
ncbi:MAG: DUF4159 domain-containing protein [Chloroflexi bacterium]|nr:DUF4159 domain-containing protein [Chloroflexota bacterium]